MRTPQENESLVTVVFAGLMFFRHNEAEHFFNVGILRAAPDHFFRIIGPKILSDPALHPEMDLEIINQMTGTARRGATPRILGMAGEFDRTSVDHPSDDYRYIVNFDDLYPTGYQIDEDALRPNINVMAGEVYTLCRTEFLLSKKGDDAPTDFGFMADTMAADIVLEANEKLVLRDRRRPEDQIFEVAYNSGTPQTVLIANIPPTEMLGHDHEGLTHFQNYYLLIPKRFRDRFDFAFRDPTPHTGCPLPKPLIEFFKDKRLTPPPYFCGIGSGERGTPIGE